MSKIALIGPEEMVANFRLFGIDCLACENENSAEKIISEISGSKSHLIVFLVDFLAENNLEKINWINQKTGLNIVLIPGNRPGLGLAQERSRQLIRSALGSAPGGK